MGREVKRYMLVLIKSHGTLLPVALPFESIAIWKPCASAGLGKGTLVRNPGRQVGPGISGRLSHA